jgi:acyl-CoA synthetase (NDP forming)
MNPDELIGRVRSEGRGVLTEAEAKELLKFYGVPVVEEAVAKDAERAAAKAAFALGRVAEYHGFQRRNRPGGWGGRRGLHI